MTGVMHHPIDDLAQRRRGKPARRGLSWKRTFDVLAADGAHEVLLPPKPPHPRSRPTGGGCGNSPPREAFFVVCSASEPSEIQSSAANFPVYLHDDTWHPNFPVTSDHKRSARQFRAVLRVPGRQAERGLWMVPRLMSADISVQQHFLTCRSSNLKPGVAS